MTVVLEPVRTRGSVWTRRSVWAIVLLIVAALVTGYILLGIGLAVTGAGRAGRCGENPGCGKSVLYEGNVLSPGGWTVPAGERAGWGWVPEDAAIPRPDLAPIWIRVAYELPWLDRFASQWMWDHGAFEIEAPPAVGDADS